MQYQSTIGLEIHVELKTQSKMFCSCPNDPNERHPNFNICPVCTGQPGVLPVINEEAVKKVIKTGLALNCQIQELSKFDRKNYFYPDLPKGYQISQYDKPLCKNGFLEINGKKIRITRIHLEEDTGRLIHPEKSDYSLVDFNRAGVPLMELVTEPDIHSAEEARKFAEEFQLILRYLGVSDADMEKGEMRVEVNVSLRPNGNSGELGVKVEIKNLNSFRAVERGIEYEIKRQTELLDGGKKIVQETRGWDDAKGVTVSQREKEESHDYRYFPEPDLPPLEFKPEEIERIKGEITELPESRRQRFKKEYGIGDKEIEFFTQNRDLGDFFEKVSSELVHWMKDADISRDKFKDVLKLATNYIITDLQGLLVQASVVGEDFLITPENFAEFVILIFKNEISSRAAKIVLAEMFGNGSDPSHIIEEKNLKQVSGEAELETIVGGIIEKNPQPVEDYKNGKENALQFLIGQAMAKTRGRANPQILRELFKKIIG